MDKKTYKIFGTIVGIVMVLGILFTVFSLMWVKEERERLSKSVLSLEPSYDSYREYRKITPLNLHMSFYRAYDSKKYGSSTLLFDTLNGMGAKVSCKDKSEFLKQLASYWELRLTSYIYNPKLSRPGDIIVFKPVKKGKQVSQRMGIVERFEKGYVRFVESNSTGIVFSTVKTSDKSIQYYVEFSYPVWAGVALYKGMRVVRGLTPFHRGYDLRLSNYDRKVFSFTDGKVKRVYNRYSEERRYAPENRSGNYVIIEFYDQGEKYEIRYVDLIDVAVSKGQVIKKDMYLGTYGDVGNSTGPHLHLGLFNSKGEVLDPLPLLRRSSDYVLYGRDLDKYYVALFGRPMNSDS